MNSKWSSSFLGLLLLVVAVWVAVFGRLDSASAETPRPLPNALSEAIYPRQEIAVVVNHSLHLKKLGMTCTQCHSQATRSRLVSDRLLPAPRDCDRCHHSDHSDLEAVKAPPDDRLGACGLCHLGYQLAEGNHVQRTRIPNANLHFNHAIHAARNIGCLQCHPAVPGENQTNRQDLPKMQVCAGCHLLPGPARGKAPGACSACHLTEEGHLRTQFPSGQLLPPKWLGNAEHGPDWLRRHGRVAGNDSQLCANCHTEQSCTACHDGRVRDRRVHPNDWLTMHGLASRQSAGDCRSCHRQQSFCVTCHQRSGVAQSGGYDAYMERGRFHPPKAVWSDPPRTRQHHAWQAQRNLDSCVSCHVERDCVVCHATAARGGMGSWGAGRSTDPHPAGFLGQCGRLLRRNPRPCLVCHEPADPRMSSCQ